MLLKVRITYVDQEEKEQLMEVLRANFRILSESIEYQGRGKSIYKNQYIDLDKKEC